MFPQFSLSKEYRNVNCFRIKSDRMYTVLFASKIREEKEKNRVIAFAGFRHGAEFTS